MSINISQQSEGLQLESPAHPAAAVSSSSLLSHLKLSKSVWFPALCTLFLVSVALVYQRRRRRVADVPRPGRGPAVTPVSVNYHFTRQCNYKCGFCFHTAKTSYLMPLDDAKRGLRLLKKAGMEKINFSGGEPFLPRSEGHGDGEYIGEMVKYCKRELRLESVSIVSNGSLIKEEWFAKYGEYLDILAISCDSFCPETNRVIGRHHKGRDHIDSMKRVKDWCMQYKVAFKMNTVVNSYNKDEDMTEEIQQLNPCRWKVFQCLLIEGENAGEDARRNAELFQVTDEQFDAFIDRHKSISCLVREGNEEMRRSYLIVDEYMRFLDGATKQPSRSILDVGVNDAMDAANFDEKMFYKRGGKYKWSKADMELEF